METISVASLGLGVAFSLGLSYFFFYVAYPFIIWKLGLIEGGITMTCFSLHAKLYRHIVLRHVGQGLVRHRGDKGKTERAEGQELDKQAHSGTGKEGRPVDAGHTVNKIRPVRDHGLSEAWPQEVWGPGLPGLDNILFERGHRKRILDFHHVRRRDAA